MTAALPSRRRRSFRALELRGWRKWALFVGLCVVAVITLLPFYSMLVLSLRPGKAVTFPMSLLPVGLDGSEYLRILQNPQVIAWFFNTLLYSLVGVIVVLVLSAMAGYAFAKKRFPGREALFWIFIAMVMVPYQVTLIPTFIGVADLGGVDSYWGLIVPTLANAQAVFLMRQFVQGIPDELFEAARLDGASELRMFVQIVLPLSRPILATLAVFVFLWHWNDFLWPLIVERSSSMWTLTVGVASLNTDQVPLSAVLSGSAVAFLPIFIAYLFAQRQVREGMMASGIKG